MNSYLKFLLMLTASFVIMYAVMFLNVADTDHIYLSTMRLYMALLMVAPMALLMLAMMPKMYPDKRKNRVIGICAIVVFGLAFTGMRSQAFIDDEQWMNGMISHHSSAILTSTKADIRDPEARKLATEIIDAQRKEIAQMQQMLERLD